MENTKRICLVGGPSVNEGDLEEAPSRVYEIARSVRAKRKIKKLLSILSLGFYRG